MAIQRQAEIAEGGRANQKRRTRAAVVNAATDLMRRGITPTVPQAAEEAMVSRTTAYRYFPTQESLLMELSVHADVGDIEALVAEPCEPADAPVRAVELIELLNAHVRADEVRYRNALRLYQDQWLEATAKGDDQPIVREGRRVRWLSDTLAPLAKTVPARDLDRLVAALSLLTGFEAVTVLSDVCQLDEKKATAVTEWAARVLIDATLGDAT